MDVALVVGGVAAAATLIALTEVAARRVRLPPGSRTRAVPSTRSGLRDGLRGTRSHFASRLADAFGRDAGGLFERLEESLVAADVGVQTARVLVDRVRRAVGGAVTEAVVRDALRQEMIRMLAIHRPGQAAVGHPHVVMVVGVNGVGKTTTVAKLAARHHGLGRRVLVVAADTFRAAAADQLEVWARRIGVGLVRHRDSSSPAAVVFDGMAAATSRDVDVVLIDTAGRLHTRLPLVEELRKVRRVIAESVPGAPHEILVVLDATTGQNALSQARTFADAVAVTGVVLTKLDGTARGGVALAIANELGVAITDVGIGEEATDLRPFEAAEFVAAILGDPDGSMGDRQELRPRMG